MRLQITSSDGHHNCDVEPAIAKVLYEKLTGRMTAPLPVEIKEKVPDNFQELKALWEKGKVPFLPYVGKDGDFSLVEEFDPKIEKMVFLAPQVGG